MHSRLETYLTEVANHLGPLPLARREEELMEMRRHLEDAVSAYQEAGQSEEDAAAKAIKQFGMPEELGEKVVWAWLRADKRENIRSFLGSVACVTALLYLGGILFGPIQNDYIRKYQHDVYMLNIGMISFSVIICALIGCFSGFVFPKRAIQGVGAALIVNSAYPIYIMSHSYLHNMYSNDFNFVYSIACNICINVFGITIAVLSARAGSRRRLRRKQIAW